MTEEHAEMYHFLVFLIFGESYNFDAPPRIENPKELMEAVESVLDTLSDAEVSFLKSRFGLIDGDLKSLEEMAILLGKGVEELQVFELDLMKKLRHPARSENLRKYLD